MCSGWPHRYMADWRGVNDRLISELINIAADANILINSCRLAAQRYNLTYQEPMPVEQLVQSVCDTKQVQAL
jgi:20S proteasome subunit alpha 3